MRIASLGDLHLGPSAQMERFCQREEVLLSLSAHLEETHDQIVLTGDVYQADYGWRLGPDPTVVQSVRQRFPRLSARWDRHCYVHLPGNHDDLPIARQASQGGAEMHIQADDVSVLYLHGHQFDPISRGLGARLTMWSMARLRRLDLRRLCAFLEEQMLERGHRLLAGDEHLGLAARAAQLIQERSCTIVVMGHSHERACCWLGDGVYANSGICVSGDPAFVSIDTKSKRVELCTFDPLRGRQCLRSIDLRDRLLLGMTNSWSPAESGHP
jgi:UDP-2,3-diacylglucosamine pyrophosphatase LpxH